MPEGPTPVILSLDRMTKIHDVYPTENVLICEAGTILVDVQQAAADNDRLFPMSLATNAGGVNVLRHGNMRAQCLGLEVVRPDGTIWNGLSRLRKDNTGYDLRDLMIGSEGTLGIITTAALRLMLRPQAQGTAMMAVCDPAAALDLLALAGDIVGEGLSAFELIHRQGLDFLAAVGPDIKTSFTDVTDWCVLVDVGLAVGGDPQEVLMALFEAGLTPKALVNVSSSGKGASPRSTRRWLSVCRCAAKAMHHVQFVVICEKRDGYGRAILFKMRG